MDPAVQDDPFATYVEMHERCPVHRLPETGLVGAALARQELLSVFQAVVARMDNLALAEPLAEQPHEFSFFLRPMKQLQLSFSAKGDPA